jgi:hypothetical protein
VAFGEMDLISGVAFGEMDLIREVVFGEMDLISGVAFVKVGTLTHDGNHDDSSNHSLEL